MAQTNNSGGGSTTQLKRVLGFGDLMGAAVGQIIGAGIMTLLGSTMLRTGRSLPLAFLIAFVIICCQYLPLLFIGGTVRVRGGSYTTAAMLAGKNFAGAYSIIYLFSNLSISMYALSFAEYLIPLMGFGNVQVVALIILTLFFLLNCFGIDKFAITQNIIVILLVVALGLLVVFGFKHGIDPNYFAEETWMTGGVLGLFQAGGLLTFAVGGGNEIINLSAEAKNPTKDIPKVMIISTLIVSALYGVIAFVAAGVLPLDQVAGKNLSVVAQEVLPYGFYVFFVICGAGFALISTLNAKFAWAPKPTMQACDDGWFPAGLAKLSRWNTPIVILTILYAIAVICIVTGLSIDIIGNMCQIANGFMNLMINWYLCRLPEVIPEEWNSSKFKVSNTTLRIIAMLGVLASALNIFLNASDLSPVLLALNAIVVIGAFVFAAVRGKHAKVVVSYEKL